MDDKLLTTYRQQGVIVVPHVIDDDQIQTAVEDIWTNIENLPWKKEFRTRWHHLHENMKNDVTAHAPPVWGRPVTKKESKEAKEIYPSMGGFGALNPPPFYHLNSQWQIRQDPRIVDIFSQILDTDELMVALDRVSFKYPGMGENEFCHWDSNPFFWDEEEYESVQGIIALSDTSFFAVPGTHTKEFQKEFTSQYPATTRRDQYFVLEEHDPLKLRSKVVEYPLRAGDLVIWSNRLLHEARINKKDTIRYAYYLTYFPHGRPPPTVVKAYKSKKIDWKQDRIASYTTGRNPLFYPSGTKIELYSKQVYMSPLTSVRGLVP